MTSKDGIIAVLDGKPADYVPLTAWCFGFPAPEALRWQRDGVDVRFWYSLRMEHIHTLNQPWTLDDDFQRVLAWRTLGLDDILDVSVPWGIDPEVRWKDIVHEAGTRDEKPVLERKYTTPVGPLCHAVRQTREEQGEGWVVQPDHVPLIEDFNIPRAVEHAVSSPEDVPRLKYLFTPPGKEEKAWFEQRMSRVRAFASEQSVPVQAWSAFGMDAAVWFTGTESAILMAMDHPQAMHKLLDIITETDIERTRLAASAQGVDIIVERGWYSSTDFWSPQLFESFMFPRIKEIASVVHEHGKKFCYTMTTGVEQLGPRLADAGVDILYFVDPIDPVHGVVSLSRIRDLLAERMILVGGVSSITLCSGDMQRIDSVKKALDILGPTGRFILQPVDALFPDTPWEGLQKMIEAWKHYR